MAAAESGAGLSTGGTTCGLALQLGLLKEWWLDSKEYLERSVPRGKKQKVPVLAQAVSSKQPQAQPESKERRRRL